MFKEKEQTDKARKNIPKLIMNILYISSAAFAIAILITAYFDIWNDTYDFEIFVRDLYATLLLSLCVSFFTAYGLMGYVKFFQNK